MYIALRSSITMIFLFISVSFVSSAANAACTPSADEVAVYQHANYRGICSVLPEGDYLNSAQLRMKNDSISSLRTGRNVQIKACKHAQTNVVTGGLGWFDDPQSCQTFVGDIENLGGHRLGNDSISSASVVRRPDENADLGRSGSCRPGIGEVAVYQFKELKGNCRILPVGSYVNSSQVNFKNDSISSIQIGRGSRTRMIVCQDSSYGGRCETLTKTDLDLSDNQVGDNSITSIKVYRD